MRTTGRFGAGMLLVCAIVFVAACSSDDPPAGVEAADEEVGSDAEVTSYTYKNSPVEAVVMAKRWSCTRSRFPFQPRSRTCPWSGSAQRVKARSRRVRGL